MRTQIAIMAGHKLQIKYANAMHRKLKNNI